MEIDLQYIENLNSIKSPAHIQTISETYDPVFFSEISGSINVILDQTVSGSSLQNIHSKHLSLLNKNLRFVNDTFKLTDNELATLCKVTRKTIHNWKNDNLKMHSKNSSRLFNLVIASKNWIENGYQLTKNELHNKVISNKSVFDILSESPINLNILNMAGQRLAFSQKPKELDNPFA